MNSVAWSNANTQALGVCQQLIPFTVWEHSPVIWTMGPLLWTICPRCSRSIVIANGQCWYLLSTNMNLSEICFTEEELSLLLLLQLLNSEAYFMGNLQLNCCVYKRGKSPGWLIISMAREVSLRGTWSQGCDQSGKTCQCSWGLAVWEYHWLSASGSHT